jgi:ABC-type glycerol-3-phosphate transport system permease component
MSTLDPKPIKAKTLNSKLLPIAALVLLVLALVFMATPLLRVSSFSGAGPTGFNRQFNGAGGPGGFTGTPQPGGNGYVFQGPGANDPTTGTQPGTATNPNTTRRFGAGGARGLVGFAMLSGITGTIVYAIALLVSLAAAIGMFLTKKWGQVLGIVMAVIYLILGLVSFLPTLLMGFMRGLNITSLGLSLVHLVLAIAVIVLASIPAKKMVNVPAAPTENLPPASA